MQFPALVVSYIVFYIEKNVSNIEKDGKCAARAELLAPPPTCSITLVSEANSDDLKSWRQTIVLEG